MIDKLTQERILNAAQIVDVIKEFVALKKRGVNYVGLCPFHKEKTPSFTVSESKGIYKCFGCGKAGNVVNFLMEHEKISYTEALRWLAKKYLIPIEEKPLTQQELELYNERELLFAITRMANEYFVKQLWNSEEGRNIALPYLYERGFEENIIKKFSIGYSPQDEKELYNYAVKNGYKAEALQKAGLINKLNNNNFAGRIIFPIFNISGNVVGFSGRIIGNAENVAKYYNSPETEIFTKGKLLFGLIQAKSAIIKNEKCYLVEGNVDVLAMHKMGFENTVASLGTALTVEQINLIKRFTRNIVIVYDGDTAGVKAALRNIDLLLQEGMYVKAIMLPENHDPDSFSREVTLNDFLDYFNTKEEDFILFKLKALLEGKEADPIKKTYAFKEIVRTISLIPDPILRTVYSKECSKILEISEKAIIDEINSLIIQQNKKIQQPLMPKKEANSVTNVQIPNFVDDYYIEEIENEILRIIIHYGNEPYKIEYDEYSNEPVNIISVAEAIIYDLVSEDLQFKNLIYKKIFELLLEQLEKYKYIDVDSLLFHEDLQVQNTVASLLAVPYYSAKSRGQSDMLSKIFEKQKVKVSHEKEFLNKLIFQLLMRYKYKILENAEKDLIKKLEKAISMNINNDEVNMLLYQIKQINDAIKEISKYLNIVVR
ncbi:MAG: DNA primase [Bacteroidales bacterium]|nr:DNA primase [Bacteroidales bacterium]